MSETLQWAIERSSQLFDRLRMFQGIGVKDWRSVLYQAEQILADLDAITAVARMLRDKAVQQLRKEAGLDA